jgi:hypothetical protein
MGPVVATGRGMMKREGGREGVEVEVRWMKRRKE